MKTARHDETHCTVCQRRLEKIVALTERVRALEELAQAVLNWDGGNSARLQELACNALEGES